MRLLVWTDNIYFWAVIVRIILSIITSGVFDNFAFRFVISVSMFSFAFIVTITRSLFLRIWCWTNYINTIVSSTSMSLSIIATRFIFHRLAKPLIWRWAWADESNTVATSGRRRLCIIAACFVVSILTRISISTIWC